MKLLDQYFELQNKIYEYFGYREDWVSIPIDDCRKYYWTINGTERNGEVVFAEGTTADEALKKIEGEGEYYSNIIYTQRFLPKWVYRGENFTMICVDTQTDGNKFLSIFDNAKELSNNTSNY